MIFSQDNPKKDQFTKKQCKQQKRRANESEKREETIKIAKNTKNR